MTPRSFVYLAGAAVLSALLAVATFVSDNPWGSAPAGGEKLMPTLANSIGQVAEVSIQQGEETTVLERNGGSWALKSRGGYPADVAKVRTMLVALGQAELAQPKTSRLDRYAALELEDPAQKDAKSRLVRITDAKGGLIAEAVLGKNRSEGYGPDRQAGTYVRKPGNPQTWLANTQIDAPAATKDWLKTSVLALSADKINRISIEIPGEQPLMAERAPAAPPRDAKADAKDTKDAKADKAAQPEAKGAKADAKDAKGATKDAKAEAKAPEPGKLAFVGFPGEGKKLKDAYAPDTLARAVASIDLDDVRKLPATAPEGASVVKVETADGLAVTLRLHKDGDANWLSITASGEGDAKKAADEITARTKDWEFKIPAFKSDLILKKRADLLEASGS